MPGDRLPLQDGWAVMYRDFMRSKWATHFVPVEERTTEWPVSICGRGHNRWQDSVPQDHGGPCLKCVSILIRRYRQSTDADRAVHQARLRTLRMPVDAKHGLKTGNEAWGGWGLPNRW